MKVYRLSRGKYSEDLSGMGSKLFGGRWNAVGTPCIYTAESRALAVLEYSVNINIDLIPRDLNMCVFDLDKDKIQDIEIEDLPGNWRNIPAPLKTKEFGTNLLQTGIPVLKIPSIVIPEEFNYILNPLASEPAFKLVEVKDFVYDLRIKGGEE